MNNQNKYDLITRNLQEIIGKDELAEIISNRNLKLYWGTAPTGKIHIAYFLPLLKIKDFLDAGCEVTILLADLHALLDNLKTKPEEIEYRTKYYKIMIETMLEFLGVTKGINFVRGSDYQKSEKYVMDLYKISTITNLRDSRKAGAQVVKQIDDPLMSSLIYPMMQALDEEYLNVDAQFGGVDQRKIFTYAMKHLPILGYKKRIHLMNPMIPGINSAKMSASDEFSKIDMLDERSVIEKKIKKSFCEPGNKETGLLFLLKYIIFPILKIKDMTFNVNVYESKSTCVFKNYEDLEISFVAKKLHPGDLKPAIVDFIDEILKPIRDKMLIHKDLIENAYPKKKK
ncbi:putative tyrosine--tRNA ligase, cytoplasmic [Dictyocoela muelleri]|nr:putative tyrosine--tRNA ligase, cytoplasmic [Dictyocoela muelleri]